MSSKSPVIQKTVPDPNETVLIRLENLPPEVKKQLESYFVKLWGRKTITLNSNDTNWKKNLRDSLEEVGESSVGDEMTLDEEGRGKKHPRSPDTGDTIPNKRQRTEDDDEDSEEEPDPPMFQLEPPSTSQQQPDTPFASPGVINVVTPTTSPPLTTTPAVSTQPMQQLSSSSSTTIPPTVVHGPTITSSIIRNMPASVIFVKQLGHPDPEIYNADIKVPINQLPGELLDIIMSYAIAPLRLYWLQTRIPYFRFERTFIARTGSEKAISTIRRTKPVIDFSFTEAARLLCEPLFPGDTTLNMHDMIDKLFPEKTSVIDTPTRIIRVGKPSSVIPTPQSVTTVTTTTSTTSTTTTTTTTAPPSLPGPIVAIDDVYAVSVLNVSYSNICMQLIQDIVARRRKLLGIQHLFASFTNIGGDFDLRQLEPSSNIMLTVIDISNTNGPVGESSGRNFWESVIRFPNLRVLRAHKCSWFTALYTYQARDCVEVTSSSHGFKVNQSNITSVEKLEQFRLSERKHIVNLLLASIDKMKEMPFPRLETLDIEDSLTIDFFYVILNAILNKQLQMAGLRGRLTIFDIPAVKEGFGPDTAAAFMKSITRDITHQYYLGTGVFPSGSASSPFGIDTRQLRAIPKTVILDVSKAVLQYRYSGSSVSTIYDVAITDAKDPNVMSFTFAKNDLSTADVDVIGSAVPVYEEPDRVPQLTNEQICQLGFINTLHELRTISRPYVSAHEIGEGKPIFPNIDDIHSRRLSFDPPNKMNRFWREEFNAKFFAIHGITLMLQFVGDLATYSCDQRLWAKKNEFFSTQIPSSSSSSTSTTTPTQPREFPMFNRWGVTPPGTCPLQILTFGNFYPQQGDTISDYYRDFELHKVRFKAMNPTIPTEIPYSEEDYVSRYHPWIRHFTPGFKKLTNLRTLEFNIPIPRFPAAGLVPDGAKFLEHLTATDICFDGVIGSSGSTGDETARQLFLKDGAPFPNGIRILQLSFDDIPSEIGELIRRCNNIRFLHINGRCVIRRMSMSMTEILSNLPVSQITGLRIDVDSSLFPKEREFVYDDKFPTIEDYGRALSDMNDCPKLTKFIFVFHSALMNLGLIRVLNPIILRFPNLTSLYVADQAHGNDIAAVFGLANGKMNLRSLNLNIRAQSININWEQVLSTINRVGLRTLRLSNFFMDQTQVFGMFRALRNENFPLLWMVSLRNSNITTLGWVYNLAHTMNVPPVELASHGLVAPRFPLNCYVDFCDTIPDTSPNITMASQQFALLRRKFGITFNFKDFPLYRGVRMHGFNVLKRIDEYTQMFYSGELT